MKCATHDYVDIIIKYGYTQEKHGFTVLHRTLTDTEKTFWLLPDRGGILLILNMIIHNSFTSPTATHFLSADVRGPVSFTVSALKGPHFLSANARTVKFRSVCIDVNSVKT